MIELGVTLAFFLSITLGSKLWGFIKYRKKYPIVGSTIPQKILKRGDIVFFTNGGSSCFQGVETMNYDLVFQNNDDSTIYDTIITRQEFLNTAVAIKNEYGYKWIKSDYNLTS